MNIILLSPYFTLTNYYPCECLRDQSFCFEIENFFCFRALLLVPHLFLNSHSLIFSNYDYHYLYQVINEYLL